MRRGVAGPRRSTYSWSKIVRRAGAILADGFDQRDVSTCRRRPRRLTRRAYRTSAADPARGRCRTGRRAAARGARTPAWPSDRSRASATAECRTAPSPGEPGRARNGSARMSPRTRDAEPRRSRFTRRRAAPASRRSDRCRRSARRPRRRNGDAPVPQPSSSTGPSCAAAGGARTRRRAGRRSGRFPSRRTGATRPSRSSPRPRSSRARSLLRALADGREEHRVLDLDEGRAGPVAPRPRTGRAVSGSPGPGAGWIRRARVRSLRAPPGGDPPIPPRWAVRSSARETGKKGAR